MFVNFSMYKLLPILLFTYGFAVTIANNSVISNKPCIWLSIAVDNQETSNIKGESYEQ